MNSEFFQFLELCEVKINETSDVATLILEYNNFNKYNTANPSQTFERNFIKWRLQQCGPYEITKSKTEPLLKNLQVEYTTTPIKLQTIKDAAPYVGEFLSYTFTPSPRQQQQQQLPTESPTKTACDNLVTNYLSTDIELLDCNMPCIDDFIPQTTTLTPTSTSTPQPTTGKNIAMAKRIHDEEERQQQREQEEPLEIKPGLKRKRAEVPPRQVGRPSTLETLIKIDGDDDDQTTFQLRTRELVLNGSGENGEKKSKIILTKCKSNIAVNTQKQYQTYELFADLRRRALDTIKEQHDMLQKINAAEAVLTGLLKKR
jgi:hypothetical protein